jgi:anti-anti-sigma regulatory factor
MKQPQETTFRLEGRFDGPAALRLRQQVMIGETQRTILDFSHVEKFDDSTLGLLTMSLALLLRAGRAAVLLGLRDHQLRVLHHFGVDIALDGLVLISQGAPLLD